jgi:ABC-type nitrate/sulfonate/bicarbonate transport system substrate-binding protein
MSSNDSHDSNPAGTLSRRQVLHAAGSGGALALGLPWLPARAQAQVPAMRAKVVYPSRSGASWPLWIASRAGYLGAEGVDVELTFGLHPTGLAALVGGEAQFTVYGLEQVLAAAAREPSMTIVSSYLTRGAFSLIARKEIRSIKDLKGKRLGVARVGDPLYTYTVELLNRAGIASTHVSWVSSGTDSATRGGMLLNGQLDAALLVAPAYFRLLDSPELHELANLLNSDISIANVMVFSKKAIAAAPQMPEAVLKACASGTKRFYEDRGFAIDTFRAFDPQSQEKDIARLWDLYARSQAIARVPMLTRAPLQASVARVAVDVAAIRNVAPQHYVDNGVVTRLIKSGFYEKLFGPTVRAEQDAALLQAV